MDKVTIEDTTGYSELSKVSGELSKLMTKQAFISFAVQDMVTQGVDPSPVEQGAFEMLDELRAELEAIQDKLRPISHILYKQYAEAQINANEGYYRRMIREIEEEKGVKYADDEWRTWAMQDMFPALLEEKEIQ